MQKMDAGGLGGATPVLAIEQIGENKVTGAEARNTGAEDLLSE